MSELTTEDRKDECLKHAIQIRTAWSLSNYHKFFALYKKPPKMSGYLIDWFADRERKLALKIMIKAYATIIIHLTNLVKLLRLTKVLNISIFFCKFSNILLNYVHIRNFY